MLSRIAKQHRIAYLARFGSYARRRPRPDCHVDLYARFGRRVGLFEVPAVKQGMEEALDLPVDLIVEEAVLPYAFVREGVAQESVVLHEVAAVP